MLHSTLKYLRCQACQSDLAAHATKTISAKNAADDIWAGHLECVGCGGAYPIIAGVAILVEDVQQYLIDHARGIAQVVPGDEIPPAYRDAYFEAKTSLADDHPEWDLETERVNALYLANHYLGARDLAKSGSPLIRALVRKYWDAGPLTLIENWARSGRKRWDSTIELGCSVGGLARRLKGVTREYLGVDNSFAAVALGRHLVAGAPYPVRPRVPRDLLEGPLSRPARVSARRVPGADLVVGDLTTAPVAAGAFDACVAMNVIDMLDDPTGLPALQHLLLKEGGVAYQSCPYIWLERVSRDLRDELPAKLVTDSARAVEHLYQSAGFKIEKRTEHHPWLFLKHDRQLEIYSVHAFQARRK